MDSLAELAELAERRDAALAGCHSPILRRMIELPRLQTRVPTTDVSR